MNSQNGTTYPQNYDIIVKWLAEALQGETLDVLGVPTGRIEEVFGFEAVDIPVNVERVDVMFRDDKNAYYHIEEQRNLSKADLYRFASYHFRGAKKKCMMILNKLEEKKSLKSWRDAHRQNT